MGYEAHGLSKLTYSTAVAAGTQYYPSTSGYEMKGRTVVTVQLKGASGTTTTIEATLMRGSVQDGVAETWVDVTASFTDLATGLAATTYVNGSAILQANGLNIHKLRIKSVTVGGASTEGYWLRCL
jgi:hypothetical protein